MGLMGNEMTQQGKPINPKHIEYAFKKLDEKVGLGSETSPTGDGDINGVLLQDSRDGMPVVLEDSIEAVRSRSWETIGVVEGLVGEAQRKYADGGSTEWFKLTLVALEAQLKALRNAHQQYESGVKMMVIVGGGAGGGVAGCPDPAAHDEVSLGPVVQKLVAALEAAGVDADEVLDG